MSAGSDLTRSRVLVAAQMALLAVLARGGRPDAAHRPPPPVRAAGWALLAGGAGLGIAGAAVLGDALTPMPEPRPGATLRTEGAYRLVRHPLYAALLLGALGRTLTTGRPLHVAATAALGAVLAVKVRHEERLLRAQFPEYAAYARTTPALLPHVRGAR